MRHRSPTSDRSWLHGVVLWLGALVVTLVVIALRPLSADPVLSGDSISTGLTGLAAVCCLVVAWRTPGGTAPLLDPVRHDHGDVDRGRPALVRLRHRRRVPLDPVDGRRDVPARAGPGLARPDLLPGRPVGTRRPGPAAPRHRRPRQRPAADQRARGAGGGGRQPGDRLGLLRLRDLPDHRRADGGTGRAAPAAQQRSATPRPAADRGGLRGVDLRRQRLRADVGARPGLRRHGGRHGLRPGTGPAGAGRPQRGPVGRRGARRCVAT